MSFCSKCGAELQGPFCSQCGAAQTPEAEMASDPNAPDIPDFLGAFTACFRKYASPHGRASRSEFWFFALWFFIANFFLRLITVVVFFGPSAVFYFSLLGALDKRTLIALQLFWLAGEPSRGRRVDSWRGACV